MFVVVKYIKRKVKGDERYIWSVILQLRNTFCNTLHAINLYTFTSLL